MSLGNKIKSKYDLFEIIDRVVPIGYITGNELFITNDQVYCSYQYLRELTEEYNEYKRIQDIKKEIKDILD